VVTFNNNRGAGVHVGGGGIATLHGGSYNGNGAGNAGTNGVEIEAAGTVTIDRGAVIQNNINSGIRTTGTGGVMTITGVGGTPIDVSRNGLSSGIGQSAGAWFANSTVTATNVAFHDNGHQGVLVNNAVGTPINISNSTFTNNGFEGLRVEVSERTATNTNSLNVLSSTFTGNQRGVTVAPLVASNVWASFQGNTLTGNLDSGMWITGTAASNLAITGNTITNNRVAATSVFGGFGAGGVVFFGTNPAVGRFSFLGNLVHHNLQNEVLAVSLGAIGVTWDLSGTATPACVPATANTFACYNAQNPSTSVGVMAVGATVVAHGNAWQNPVAPTNGTDFASAAGGSVTTPIVATCPPSAIVCP
jgi:hypothetical protein